MNRVILILALLMTASGASAGQQPLPASVERYVQPYVRTNNFAGVVLVARHGRPMFAKAYGAQDRTGRVANRLDTRFHIASMSMQFTAAAALRLIDAGKLSLDTPVSDVLPDYPNGHDITIRHLLTQTSGIADINAQPDYDEILKSTQTPASLVSRMRDVPALRPPGTYEREEHSAYNLLALLIERAAGLPFNEAVKALVFDPLDMHDSGIDDDSPAAKRSAALGYKPVGLYDLAPADAIHWSAKAGNGSAYTTAGDELKFVTGLLGEDFLSSRLRGVMFDTSSRVGYGWFKSNSARFGQPAYSMNGRAPGFASAIVYLPQDQLLVVVLSNIYASVPTDMGYEIAALALGRPFEPLELKTSVDQASLAGLPATFRFPQDFYQPNAAVRLTSAQRQVTLHWPTGDTSQLIPLGKDRYIDRSYWVTVEVLRDGSGRIVQLKYDRFTGDRTSSPA